MAQIETEAYYDLGTHTRRVTTTDAEAQVWFNRGLVWLYGYNFEAALDCFRRVVARDPACVLGYWGIAYSSGCNYNKPWRVFPPRMVARAMKQAREAIALGMAHVARATPVESALLKAVERRFQRDGAQPEDVLARWNDEFADAMRDVYLAHVDDLDVAALFADALINRTPWKLWDLSTGQPAKGADTEEARGVLERALGRRGVGRLTAHPGLLHTYIHLMEMSPHPERALRAADLLRDLVPDSGHLRHMASHIDILCGHYFEALAANDRAIAVDDKFLSGNPEMLEYALYCSHDLHFKMYAGMLVGQYGAALQAANDMRALVSHELLLVEQPPMAFLLEGLIAGKLHVLVRFGKWQDILRERFPEDRALYCNTVAMLHYARGIAYANTGEPAAADDERAAFVQAQRDLHPYRYIINNTCADILQVGAAMLDGEIDYHKGRFASAFEHLRRAVYLDDHLEYMEPWGWMMPTRHPLGALLLAQGHLEEALAVYRADLGLDRTLYRSMQHRENVWSLHGYVTCLRRLNRDEQADEVQPRLDIALARADVDISASCYCAVPTSRSCCS
jgi:tetratricopeptide (TPR) repeat protein